MAILLDMGGVILEMTGTRGFPVDRLDWRGREAMLRLVRKHGGHIRRRELDRLVFEPWREEYEHRHESGREADWAPGLHRLRLAAGGAGGGLHTHSIQLLRAWFRPYGEQLVPTPGAREALAELRSMGHDLAVVSNVPLPGQLYVEVLQYFGLAEFIGSFRFSYDCGSRKPSPVMLRLALGDLGASPWSSLMVGDRRDRDVAAGLAAGTTTVWIPGDAGSEGPVPDHRIGSLAELPQLLRDLG